MKKTILTIVCIFFTVLFFSCSSEDKKEIPSVSGTLPDMILYNATYTIGKPDRAPMTLTSALITIYEEDSLTTLENPTFIQKKSGSDEVEISGSCNYAESKNNSSIILKGDVKLTRTSDEVTIECSELTWEDEERSLVADGIIVMTYQDGSLVVVKGFKANLDNNDYEFEEIIEGRFFFED